MNTLPENIKKSLVEFLADMDVEKFSDEWRAVQVAIAMITTPSSFKKGLHVYLKSHDHAREPGCYDLRDMSIKIWPHKIQMRRSHNVYNSDCGIDENYVCRYIFPNDNYNEDDFEEVMSEANDFFGERYCQHDSDMTGHYIVGASYSIETNVK